MRPVLVKVTLNISYNGYLEGFGYHSDFPDACLLVSLQWLAFLVLYKWQHKFSYPCNVGKLCLRGSRRRIEEERTTLNLLTFTSRCCVPYELERNKWESLTSFSFPIKSTWHKCKLSGNFSGWIMLLYAGNERSWDLAWQGTGCFVTSKPRFRAFLCGDILGTWEPIWTTASASPNFSDHLILQ